ncbi:hypothetical protein EW026_g6010 [Hermanssonia centrifuga]|uniref:F-box domain-containing protein n=1 Tax=Hermanssonia centrifuga TaxID=98765 RepID=A0A4V3X9V9_9APHY|nr:hypothetical protein EW026_g6010 [Hermanssonia centrifuga]
MGSLSVDCMVSLTHTSLATADDLPNELILSIFPLLPLQSLIAARCVNQRWRNLVPLADLLPTRRKYLDFYLSVVRSPAFQEARRAIHPHLKHFDREEYLRFLTKTSTAPEEFILWVREWPASAVCGWMWPGLEGQAYQESALHWMPGSWSIPISHNPPYMKFVTFSGGKTPYDGTTLHATTVLPAALADLGVRMDTSASGWDEGRKEEASIEITVLCLGGGRAYVLDGKRGGEALAGIVYQVSGSYTMHKNKIVAKSWLELLQKDLKAAEVWYLNLPSARVM